MRRLWVPDRTNSDPNGRRSRPSAQSGLAMTSPFRLVAFAIALIGASFFITPAFAQTESAAPGSHGSRLRYPMKGDDFKKVIERKIATVKNTIDKKLERHGVSADRRAQIRRAVDLAAGDLRGAIEKVCSDGVVTKDEGAKVKALTEKLRGKVREQLRNEKNAQKKNAGDKPRDKAKGDAKADEKAGEKKAP